MSNESTMSCCGCRDQPAMVRFYEQALGFKVERTPGPDQPGADCAPAPRCLIWSPPSGATDAPNMDHLCFRIEPFDRDAIVTRLAPFGISVGETVERYGAEGNGPSVYFHDPEGNQIELKGPQPARRARSCINAWPLQMMC